MIRQTITLGNYIYLVDLYKASDTSHYEEFVILKTTNMLNSILYDKDIFFIHKSVICQCIIDGKLDADLLGKTIAFPISNDYITISYSSNYKKFNSNYIEETFNLDSDDSDIFKIYDQTLNNEANILCNKLRIWLPVTNSYLKGLIHVTNIINDIKFHYICQNLETFQTSANGEIKYGNNIYYEYIDVWIPNLEYFFSPSTNYIKELTNIPQLSQKIECKVNDEDFFTIYPKIYFDRVEQENQNETETAETTYEIVKKLSIEAFKTSRLLNSVEYNIIIEIYSAHPEYDDFYHRIIISNSYWENFSLKYDDIIIPEDDDSIYYVSIIRNIDSAILGKYNIYQNEIKYYNDNIYCSTLLSILPFYIDEYQSDFLNISTICKTYLNLGNPIMDNILANPLVVSLWPFDKIDDMTKSYIASTQLINNADIFTLSNDIKLQINFVFNKRIDQGLDNYGKYMLECKFLYPTQNSETIQQFYMRKLGLSIYNYLKYEPLDTYDEDIFNTEIDKCGFIIELDNDRYFKNPIFKYIKNINIEDEKSTIIDNYDFLLSFGIENGNWNTYPETLVIRVKYIDKVSFTILESNPLFVTKDNFKYIINSEETNCNRLALLDKNRANQVSDQVYNLNTQENNDMIDLTYFNFIDKINCSIITKENGNNEISNSKTSQKIIYKPVFYKIRDLQQLKLKSGITQNIGINLSEIISKVDTFKVIIEEKEYPEIARNEGYVIFRINAQEFTTSSGQYNLLDQDDQYINDGTWYVY